MDFLGSHSPVLTGGCQCLGGKVADGGCRGPVEKARRGQSSGCVLVSGGRSPDVLSVVMLPLETHLCIFRSTF